MVIRSASVYGPKLALEDLNPTPINKVSFNELLDYILRFGNALTQLGIKERLQQGSG
jgi:long-chain acyl-CoA synthetase